ncbi:MAG: GAF domain-containing protein [Candidatus Omnitrophica bacterium]|nr:GAF domain-containing protein [Candidatus Omnitrophota bacterium]MDD5653485.1 GAF domain-containing protein [Candidatus Omnitrophota bacterium]
MKKNYYLREVVLSFVIFDSLNYLFFRSDPGFMRASLNPYWIAVLLIPCRYGFIPGLVVSAVASAHIILFVLQKIPTRTGLEMMVEAGNFFLPIAFVMVGSLLGGIRQKYKNSEEQKEWEMDRLQESLRSLNAQVEASEKARRILESRIVGETSTVKTLYSAAKKLETLDDQSIYTGCLDLLGEYFQVSKASLYVKTGDYFVLKASRGLSQAEMVEGKAVEKNSIMALVLKKNNPVTVRDILQYKDSQDYISQYGNVLAMFPLKDENGQTRGVVNIEKIDFLQLNKTNLELMELIVDWAGRALSNKQVCDLALEKRFWDDDYGVYSFGYLPFALEREFARAREFNTQFTLSLLKLEGFGFFHKSTQDLLSRTMIALMKRNFFATDMFFRHKIEGVFVLVSPQRQRGAVLADFKKLEQELKEKVLTQNCHPGMECKLNIYCVENNREIQDARELLGAAEKLCGVGVSNA